MGKRGVGVLFLGLILVFVMTGCEDGKVYTYADFLGEWDLPNETHVSIMQDDTDPSNKMLDIAWYEGLTDYFAMVNGTVSGTVFTGSYVYNETTYVDEDDDTGTFVYHGSPKSVTITLTMYQDKPKVTCTGEGPLAGKTFSM
ncbi:MAG: hypothetical protein RBR15_06955 [Sphaerochaeta sp.]|nr:hypothetical protein [Sphaerochaeta sp.]